MFNTINTIFFVLCTVLGFVLPTLFTLLVEVLAVGAPVLAVARDTVLSLASYTDGAHAKVNTVFIGDIGGLVTGALRSCKTFTITLIRLATQCLRGYLLSTLDAAEQYAAGIHAIVNSSTVHTSALLLVGFTLTALEDAYDAYQNFGVVEITAPELSASSASASIIDLSDLSGSTAVSSPSKSAIYMSSPKLDSSSSFSSCSLTLYGTESVAAPNVILLPVLNARGPVTLPASGSAIASLPTKSDIAAMHGLEVSASTTLNIDDPAFKLASKIKLNAAASDFVPSCKVDAAPAAGPGLDPKAVAFVPQAAVTAPALDAPIKSSILNSAASPFVPRGLDTISLPFVLNPHAVPFAPAQSPPNLAATPDDLTPALDVLSKPSLLTSAASAPLALTAPATSAQSSPNPDAASLTPKSVPAPEPVPQLSACELELLAHVTPFPSSRSFDLFPLPASVPLRHSASFDCLRVATPAPLVASPTCPVLIPGSEAGQFLDVIKFGLWEEGSEDSWSCDEKEVLLSAAVSFPVSRVGW
ncbi:hypothetical protein FA95DRAFT_1678728 [Auriscalpium vulgare]|uniref:Uncharacterized protein n=1 Tax=Auriscalpium vulgare TaxID=40419 RepID=A0ACB8RUE6_9AGAM|nr:hypothetical protein FA95DRAFT_1678728 [Auriscalpium vulgare]